MHKINLCHRDCLQMDFARLFILVEVEVSEGRGANSIECSRERTLGNADVVWHPHFTDEKNGDLGHSNNLPQSTWLLNARTAARILLSFPWSQIVSVPHGYTESTAHAPINIITIILMFGFLVKISSLDFSKDFHATNISVSLWTRGALDK